MKNKVFSTKIKFLPKISFTRLMVTSSFFLCKITVQLRKYFSNYNQILNVHLLACFLNMSKNPSRVWGLSHSQQRVPNSPILPNPLFKKFSFTPCTFCCLVLLAEWVTFPHLIYMSSLGTIVPEGPSFVFYATKHQVY